MAALTASPEPAAASSARRPPTPTPILATILYHRKPCTGNVLADLFHVSRRTIGTVIAEITPPPEQHGPVIEPASIGYATAADILASVTNDTTPHAAKEPSC